MEKVRYINFNTNSEIVINNVNAVWQVAEVTKLSIKRKKVVGSGKKEGTYSTVEPIRDLRVLKKMRQFFVSEYERTNNQRKKLAAMRNNLLFIIGLNSALRIGDILNLTWENLLSGDRFIIKESKTKKFNNKFINNDIVSAVEKYKTALSEYEITYADTDKVFDITSQNFIKVLKRAGKMCGFTENIGTHTMRKTFSYWYLMNNKGNSRALTVLCSLLNHSEERVTLNYAGISLDEWKTIFDETSKFYRNVDNGTIRIYDDKITVSKSQIEELIRYAYSLGKEPITDFNADVDNLATLNDMLADLEL